MEDPDDIRLNILHYEHLLTLYCTEETREQLIRLLGEAQEQLPIAMAEALDRTR
jgi:hypothetical protein